MLPIFATEFPVNLILDRAAFVELVVAWLRGTKYSSVLEAGTNADLDSENAFLRSETGEELRLRELLRDDGSEIIGFRHDFPDDRGRIWRTEAVLRCNATGGEQSLLRVRTQCVAQQHGAHLEIPRKPYFLKTILQDGLGGQDGSLDVSDQPIWLDDTDEGLLTAQLSTTGNASKHLPIIFISAINDGSWLLSEQEIEKLAFDLGGVAHVIVEPNRRFSFRLRGETKGANVYGGTIGLALPERGLSHRFYLGWQFQDSADLITAIRTTALNLRSQMPAIGWDWSELQEQVLRMQRERDRARLTAKQIEQLYQEEINTLQEQNRALKELLASRPITETLAHDHLDVSSEISNLQVGPEIYRGEISDRLRMAVNIALSVADQISLDRRSRLLFEEIMRKLPVSPSLNVLLQDLDRATKNSKRVAADVTSVLLRYGYREKSDNKHIRLEAKTGFTGLDTITLPKTPSDGRGLKNLQKQIAQALGVTKLSA